MTDTREQKKTIEEMKQLHKNLSKSPEQARAFLVRAGIVTPKGNLRKPYK